MHSSAWESHADPVFIMWMSWLGVSGFWSTVTGRRWLRSWSTVTWLRDTWLMETSSSSTGSRLCTNSASWLILWVISHLLKKMGLSMWMKIISNYIKMSKLNSAILIYFDEPILILKSWNWYLDGYNVIIKQLMKLNTFRVHKLDSQLQKKQL